MSNRGGNKNDIELLPAVSNTHLPAQRTTSQPVVNVCVKPALTRMGDNYNKKKLDAYSEVVESANRLAGILRDHTKAVAGLLNVHEEIADEREAARIQRQIQLNELRRQADSQKKLADKRDRLDELDVDGDIAEAEKRLRKANGERDDRGDGRGRRFK